MLVQVFTLALSPLLCKALQVQQTTIYDEENAAGAKDRPNILFILLDDLGWADVSFNRPKWEGVQTPNIDKLKEDGIKLDRHYVHKTCSPTRSAIQSGRDPIHVNVLNLANAKRNPDDPISGFSGIPRHMTGIAEVLRSTGYATHMVGKWDAGMATPDHTPAGRGYDTSLVYFSHDNDCWTAQATESQCWADGNTYTFKDLWEHDDGIPHPGRPAVSFINGKTCSFANQVEDTKCVYEDEVFEERVKAIIRLHNDEHPKGHRPFFIFWATRTVHGDYQPPRTEQQLLDMRITSLTAVTENQRTMHEYYAQREGYFSMVTWIDGAIGRVITVLKTRHMYNNTLIVFTSDNGAQPGGNNYPLRGSKWSSWEGGIRACAFVSGGWLPDEVRGTTTDGLVAAWDWYATFAHLAGADPQDKNAKEAGLPAVDSINIWPLIIGKQNRSPRESLVIGGSVDDLDTDGDSQTQVSGLLQLHEDGKLYKLLIGNGPKNTIRCSAWGNPLTVSLEFKSNIYPIGEFCNVTTVCGTTVETGCLFNVDDDPSERHNLAKERPKLFSKLMADVAMHNETVFSPKRGKTDPIACQLGTDQYDYFWGPFVMLPNSSTSTATKAEA